MAGTTRELVLKRLLAIGQGIEGVTAARNAPAISASRKPCVVIFDGDEEANDDDPLSRPDDGPRRIVLSPEVWLYVSADTETVGTALNALRSAWIKAVFADAQLKALLGPNGYRRYQGTGTSFGRGSACDGEALVTIDFVYIMTPSKL
jgi:hypothetical protein